MMPRRPPLLRERDVVKVLKGAKAAGVEIARIEIEPAGKIVLVAIADSNELLSPLEKWKQTHGAN